jgi:hypothetical protein
VPVAGGKAWSGQFGCLASTSTSRAQQFGAFAGATRTDAASGLRQTASIGGALRAGSKHIFFMPSIGPSVRWLRVFYFNVTLTLNTFEFR